VICAAGARYLNTDMLRRAFDGMAREAGYVAAARSGEQYQKQAALAAAESK